MRKNTVFWSSKMIKRGYILSGFLFLLYSCTTTEFVQTGNSYPPLSEDEEIEVVMWGDQGKYEVIGIAEIGASTIENRINKAKKIARENGGNAIMPKGIDDQDNLSKMDNGYQLHDFLILRTKEILQTGKESKVIKDRQKSIPIEFVDKPKEKTSVELPDIDLVPLKYDSLPRATIKILLRDFEVLKGEKFRGTLYPVQIIKIPKDLISYVDKNKKLVMLKTKSGKYTLYLAIPKDIEYKFKKKIDLREILNFVYTPLAVHKSRYPVLNFVEEIE